MDECLIIPLVSLLIITFLSVPLSNMLVWNNMICFTDALAHSSLLGIVLAEILSINYKISIIFMGILSSVLLLNINKNELYNMLINISAISYTAFAILLYSLFPNMFDFRKIMTGDIMFITIADLYNILFYALFIITVILYRWKKWLLITISSDLSKVYGYNIKQLKMEIMIIITIFIANIIEICGVLFSSAVLLFPALFTSIFSYIYKSLQKAVFLSIILSLTSTSLGFYISMVYDIAPVAFIVIVNLLLSCLLYLVKKRIVF